MLSYIFRMINENLYYVPFKNYREIVIYNLLWKNDNINIYYSYRL